MQVATMSARHALGSSRLRSFSFKRDDVIEQPLLWVVVIEIDDRGLDAVGKHPLSSRSSSIDYEREPANRTAVSVTENSGNGHGFAS